MKQPKIAWGPRSREAPVADSRTLKRFDSLSIGADSPFALVSASLRATGVPSVVGAASPKEDATGLLMLAAEVEHALMAQYLYAGLSLRGVAARQLSHVAVQEMGHLVTVQNLLLSLNGLTAEGLPVALHLGRDGMRRDSDRNPLPLILEPVSRSALGKFVVVERPYEIEDPALAIRVDLLERDAAAKGISVHPVYALYAAIRWIFQSDDGDEPEGLTAELGLRPGWHLVDADFADPAMLDARAAEPIEWHSVPDLIVTPVRDRSEALAALDAIAAQGEGLPGTAKSHFSEFVDLFDQFESGGIGVKPLPVNPTTVGQLPPEGGSATLIEHGYTSLWAKLFDVIYETLLLDIAWALSQPRGVERTAIIDICIATMSKVVQPIASDLCGRPLREAGQEKAGPPFAIASEEVPDTMAGFQDGFDSCLGRQAALRADLAARPEFAADPFARLRFAAIDAINAARGPYLPQGA